MLKFTKNKYGIMGLTISQIGLLIATGIIIVAVYSFIFQNDWQIKAELKNISSNFSTLVEGMDIKFFENKTKYYFQEKSYNYNVSISSEYIILSGRGNLNNIISIKEQFIIETWPRSLDQIWRTGEELHNYCFNSYGHYGTNIDPITQDNLNTLNSYKNESKIDLAKKPLYIKLNKAMYIEKVQIYINEIEKQDFLLIYQIE